jgi:hypothetical protein
MDSNAFLKILLSADSALLPGATAVWLVLHLGWAIVLGCGVRLLAGRFMPRYQSTLAWLVLFWTLLPGAASPAFWLGLAFQSPSLISVLLCLGCLLQQQARRAPADAAADAQALSLLLFPAVLLGWVLLLDTLGWFPVSIYAWGFTAAALVAALVVAALLWLQQGSLASALLLCVLVVFALTRLPSGNLWDALLDPLLWVTLQGGWLFSVLRRRWQARRLPRATRA